MLRKQFLSASILMICASVSFAQKPPSNTNDIEKDYQTRILKERLNGVYIPKDLYDAFEELKDLMDDQTIFEFKNLPEERAGKKFYLIMWITHNWGFYGGSRISNYVGKIGIHHPEHGAHFLVTTFHRHLNEKDLGIKERVEFYQKKIEDDRKQKLETGTILHQETRKRPKETPKN